MTQNRLSMLYPPQSHARLRFGSYLHTLLTSDEPADAERRAMLERMLAEAAERGWISDESAGRLRAGDDSVVIPMFDELLVARWLDQQGYTLSFNPPGARGRIGELLLERDGRSLFLEVKSLLPAESLVLYQVTVARLLEISAAIPIAARLTLEIDISANSGLNAKELRRYMETGAVYLLEGSAPPPAYMHSSGVRLRAVACAPQPGAPHLQLEINGDVWPEQLALAQRLQSERLWRTMRGGYSQLPHNGPPTMIMVIDHTAPLNLEAWLAQIQEMLRMGTHRHLSAIMRLLASDLWAERPQPIILLNPKAIVPLEADALTDAPERWLCVLPP